jgi:hypothetical protein
VTIKARLILGTTAAFVAIPAALAGCAPTPVFANCSAMHAQYPHGVGRTGASDHTRSGTKPVLNFYRSDAIYNANTKSDADHDGVACEAH